MKIGFIGLGVMGSEIVLNLLDENNTLYVYTRTKNKATKVIEAGASYCDSIAEVVKNSDIIMTMVGFPSDVEEVYFKENGIIDNLSEGKIVIDLTTSTPSLAIKISDTVKEKGCLSLDAPVSGGDKGAKNATLTIMVGGSKLAYDQVLDIFKTIGDTYVLQGEAGSGQHTKMCNQIALANNMVGAIELIIYSRGVGLDPLTVLESVKYGSAGSVAMDLYTARIFEDDYMPGFYVKHFIKDLKIAVQESHKHNMQLPGLENALKLYEILEQLGHTELGTQALIKVYEDKYVNK